MVQRTDNRTLFLPDLVFRTLEFFSLGKALSSVQYLMEGASVVHHHSSSSETRSSKGKKEKISYLLHHHHIKETPIIPCDIYKL